MDWAYGFGLVCIIVGFFVGLVFFYFITRPNYIPNHHWTLWDKVANKHWCTICCKHVGIAVGRTPEFLRKD